MRVITKAILDLETMEWDSIDSYEYEGPVARAGGGPSREQVAASQQQLAQSKQDMATQREMLDFFKGEHAKVDPFESKILSGGLPYLRALTDFQNGTIARSALPARAQLLRSLGGNDAAQPNGFKQAVLGDFSANLARGFDDNMTNALNADYAARQQAASVLTNQQQLANPLGWSGAVTSGNSSIMQAPLATPSPFGAILGAGAGLAGTALTKF